MQKNMKHTGQVFLYAYKENIEILKAQRLIEIRLGFK